MSTRTWKRFVAMLLASIMTFTMLPMGVLAEEPVVADDQQVAATMDLEQPVEEPAEEPAAEPTEAERLMAKIDNMLLRYLGDRFKGNDRTNEEIVAEVNKLSRSEIVAIVNGLADNRFERLVAEVANMKDAINDLTTAADRAACNGRGVFAALCDATAERKNSTESAALIEARETIISVNAYCGNADLSSMGPEQLQSVISAINTMIIRIEHLDAVDRPAIEAQYGATIDALSDVLYAAEARLTEVNALMAFYAEVELFGMKYNTMADPEILAEGMKYWELLDCKAEIKALENTINALAPTDAAQYGHLLTFIAELKAAVQVRIDDLAPKLHSDSLRRDLLPLLEEAREIYCLPYTEEDLWIKLETKVALIARGEDPAGDFAKIERIITTYEQLMDNHKAQIDEEYGAEIVFLTELYADLAELAATPLDMQTRAASKFDTTVTGGYYNILSEKDYNIISGVTETEIVMNNSSGSRRQVFRLFSINPLSSSIQLVPGYYQIDKYASDPTNKAFQSDAKVTDMAAYYENNLGYDIIGGMNTALAYDSNAPYSFLMWEGKVLQDKNDSFDLGYDWLNQHSGNCQTYLAIKKDGSVELRGGTEPFEADDWNCIGANFGWLVKDGVLVSKTVERTTDAASRSMIGIKADGTLILCQSDGRISPVSFGQSNYEMGEMMLALGCVWAFNCDGGGSSTFISQRAGESGLTMRSTPSDGAERPTLNAIFIAKAKGMTPGIFDVAQIHSEYDYFAPYTTYNFAVEAIDTTGAAMTMPEGGVWSLSDETFGTITDGTFVSNGKLGTVAVQFTVGGKTAEYLINVVHPDSLSFGADGTVIPYGKSVTLNPTVLYGADDWDVYYQADTFTWEFSDNTVGTWDPATLTYTATADESKKGSTLTVTYKHSDALAAVSYKLEFGKGSEIVAGWNFENGDVSDWMGFSAAKAWSIANGVNNSLVGSDPLAGQFSPENDAHTFLATASNGQVKNGNYALGITFDNSDSSFRGWTYNVLFNVGETRVFRDVANGLNATTLGFWLYIPEGGPGLAFQSQFNSNPAHVTDPTKVSCVQDHFMFTTVSGARKNLNSATEADIPANRWVYASIDISKYDYLSTMPATNESNSRSPSFIRTYVKPETPAQLTFYIDDITLDYSSAVEDREAPVISDAKYVTADEGVALTEGAQIAGNSVGFTANIADHVAGNASGLNLASAKIYVDGIEVETEASKNAMSTKSKVALENGQHRVTFEIEDNWYNRTQLSYMINITGTEASLAVLSGHNDSKATPEADSVYYVDITAPAAETVAKIEATIRLNTANTWELEHMIVAPGYTVEYTRLDANRELTATARSVDIHSVENAVRITLTRNDDCALTGEQTLLSIPVRVWSWDGFNNVTEAPEPAPANKPTVTIDVTILSGSVEDLNGEASHFGGSMSVATTMVGAATVGDYHVHTVVALEDQAATCTEDGYTGRTYCEGCCSVIEWGETVPATGHGEYDYYSGKLECPICHEIAKVTGLIEHNGHTYFAIVGILQTQWQQIDNEWYYFYSNSYKGANGVLNCDVSYTMVNGKLQNGLWKEIDGEYRYYYGPSFYKTSWQTIDGEKYYFDDSGYRLTGYSMIKLSRYSKEDDWQMYLFAEDGVLLETLNHTGLLEANGNIYYLVNGIGNHAGLILVDGDYYYISSDYTAYVGTRMVNAPWHNDLMPVGEYTFGADGKMVREQEEVLNGIVGDYYYIDGVIQKTGMIKIGDAYYYFSTTNGVMSRNVTKTIYRFHESCDLTVGEYTFGADGKVIFPEPEVLNGIIGDYYYVDGVIQKTGMIKIGDAYYYFSTTNGVMSRGVTKKVYRFHESCDLTVGEYTFGADGKVIFPEPEVLNGIVGDYYYIDGVIQKTGMIKIGDAYYYFSTTNGVMSRNVTKMIYRFHESCDLTVGEYTFGADGKVIFPEPEILNGIVGDYYYIDGVVQKTGMIKIGDAYYYFSTTNGVMSRSVTKKVYRFHESCDLTVGEYTFGADGKVIFE